MPNDVVNRYELMEREFAEMLATARSGEWDALSSAADDCYASLRRLQALDQGTALSEAQQQRKAEIIRRLLDSDHEIRTLVEQHLANLKKFFAENRMKRKLQDSYA